MHGKFVTLTLAAGIALATPLPAQASPVDVTGPTFIEVLEDNGIAFTNASDAVQLAMDVCVMLGKGSSFTDAAMHVQKKSGLSVAQSTFFVGAANASYCPDQRS
jgi:hypothetical protein